MPYYNAEPNSLIVSAPSAATPLYAEFGPHLFYRFTPAPDPATALPHHGDVPRTPIRAPEGELLADRPVNTCLPRCFAPAPMARLRGPGRKPGSVALMPQQAYFSDEFSTHIGRQARHPPVADDPAELRFPPHNHDQRSKARRLTANHARARWGRSGTIGEAYRSGPQIPRSVVDVEFCD